MGFFSKIIETPYQAVSSFFGGMGDGYRGRIDKRKPFKDGTFDETDPSQKSKAGRGLSQYAGVRGGARTGEFAGKWGGAMAVGGYAGYTFLAPAIAAATAVTWPVIAVGLLVVAAAAIAGGLGGFLGRHSGRIGGAIVGAVGGALIGTYSWAFKKGAYEKPQEKPLETPKVPQQHKPRAVRHDSPQQDTLAGMTPVRGEFAAREDARRTAPRAAARPVGASMS
jgi:hypothetical protein